MLTIYTPGHSLYTDTLIMYAIAYAAGDSLKEVTGLGSSYALLIEGVEEDELALRLSTHFSGVRGEFSTRLARLVDERDVNASADALARVPALSGYLKSLSQPGHSREEGRLGEGRNIKLPLMPSAGKYFRNDLTREVKYRAQDYSVCPSCFAVAMMGLGLGTVSVAFRTTLVLGTLGFEGSVEGPAVIDLLSWFKAVSQGQQGLLQYVRPDEVTDRVLGNLLLTCLDDRLLVDMSASSASWKSIVVRFDVGRAVQVRGYSTVELDAVLSALAELVQLEQAAAALAEEGAQPPRCRSKLTSFLTSLLRSGSLSSLERLFDYLASRDLRALYDAVRDAYASTEGRDLMGAELAGCLLNLAT